KSLRVAVCRATALSVTPAVKGDRTGVVLQPGVLRLDGGAPLPYCQGATRIGALFGVRMHRPNVGFDGPREKGTQLATPFLLKSHRPRRPPSHASPAKFVASAGSTREEEVVPALTKNKVR